MERIEPLGRQGIARLAGFLQKMRDRMRPPDAPWLLARMQRLSSLLGGLKFSPVLFPIPFGDRVFVIGILQQRGQRFAVLRQAKHAAIDMGFGLPAVKMPVGRLEPFDAISVRVGPDDIVVLFQKFVAPQVGMQRGRAGAFMGQKGFLRQNVIGIAELDTVGNIADIAIGIHLHMVARIAEGDGAKLLQIGQVAVNPQLRDCVVFAHDVPRD